MQSLNKKRKRLKALEEQPLSLKRKLDGKQYRNTGQREPGKKKGNQ